VSATSGHNQRIINYLIMKMNDEQDLLDFCGNLEKVPTAPPQGAIERIQRCLRMWGPYIYIALGCIAVVDLEILKGSLVKL